MDEADEDGNHGSCDGGNEGSEREAGGGSLRSRLAPHTSPRMLMPSGPVRNNFFSFPGLQNPTFSAIVTTIQCIAAGLPLCQVFFIIYKLPVGSNPAEKKISLL